MNYELRGFWISEGCIPDCRFLSESGFSEFKDSQDSAAANIRQT
jgi:hypothetical protein